MKKILATILLILYLMPTFGLNVTVHYCFGKIASVSLGSSATNQCVCGIKKTTRSCCIDKNFTFQVDDNQIKTQNCVISINKSLGIKALNPISFKFEQLNFSLVVFKHNFYHPPNKAILPLYILNQVFRI